MTNFEKIKSLELKDLAMVLAYFADHDNHCTVVENHECNGCPISESGCCGYPYDPCNDSCIRWLNSECNEDAKWWKYVP